MWKEVIMNIQQLFNLDNYKKEIEYMLKECFVINFVNQDINDSYVKNKVDMLQKYINEGKAYCLGIVDNNNLLAFVWCCKVYNLCEERVHINQVIVNSQYQQQGLGKLLIKRVEEYAKNEQIDVIELMATAENKNANEFYGNLGFTVERYKYIKRI